MIAVCGSTGPDTEPKPPQTTIMETAGGLPAFNPTSNPERLTTRTTQGSPSASDHAVIQRNPTTNGDHTTDRRQGGQPTTAARPAHPLTTMQDHMIIDGPLPKATG